MSDPGPAHTMAVTCGVRLPKEHPAGQWAGPAGATDYRVAACHLPNTTIAPTTEGTTT